MAMTPMRHYPPGLAFTSEAVPCIIKSGELFDNSVSAGNKQKMATVEDRLSALESAMDEVRRKLSSTYRPRAWLDDVAGSLQEWPEFAEVLRLGREFRKSVVDPDDSGDKEN